jgi:hypothetical protein
MRYLTWRASALKVLYDRGGFQDAIDEKLVHDKLVDTLREFWPGIKPDGSCDGYQHNFWRAAETSNPDPLSEYAAMVLSLIKTVSQ